MTDEDTVRLQEIESTYEQLGLGSAAARAQFSDWFIPERPRLQFDVVIGTTSNLPS
ncbi:hypothetical protein H7H82_14885 [Mycobacterium heidelbergense]|uniref:hypothetical protein n=1 Tax=Mycobacterium heidelbergense TaxID=53376 RepID=UPI00138C9C82|nr:hypothetical protein [Mycobacterium heidelbergense]MCV7051860.1 hypothetical protein [Mycobacterium heidelbergense]BBZ49836.1 hypothetical protein MHEI_15530 [Mycobacterium heidelbergense]